MSTRIPIVGRVHLCVVRLWHQYAWYAVRSITNADCYVLLLHPLPMPPCIHFSCCRADAGGGGGIGDLCLMPPSVKREVHFLVLSVFGAEGMPRMDDKAAFGFVKAGIDAFVEVKVRGWAWLVGGTVRQGDACAATKGMSAAQTRIW
jgi:hypothetical protein